MIREQKKNTWLPYIAGFLSTIVILLIVFGLYHLFTPTIGHAKATVSGYLWQRDIHTQAYEWVDESSDYGYPAGSRSGYSDREITGYTRVYDGQSCSSSYSTFTKSYTRDCTSLYRQQAVYSTVYHYQVQRWQESTTIGSRGQDLHPYWGTFSPTAITRESSREEHYWITLSGYDDDRGHSYLFEVPFSHWNAQVYPVGTGYTLTLRDGTPTTAVMN